MRVSRRPSLIVNATLAVLALAGGALAYRMVTVSDSTSTTTAGTRTATVSTGAVTATVSASGSLASANTANANFVTSGTVTAINVKVGDPVKKGQVLAKVDPAAAKEELATAEANLTAAQDALDRAESSSTSDSATISSAEAQVTSAQQTVDSDQRAVNGTVLTAPMAGTVTAVNGSVGGSSSGSSANGNSSGNTNGSNGASSSSTTATTTSSGFIQIADLTKMEAQASFAEADATKLKAGQAATVTWSALSGATATGQVASIAPTATTTNSVNSYAVVVSLSTLPEGVRIGQTLTVVVTTGSVDNVVRVPLAAVRTAGSRHTVTVSSNGQTQVVAVQVGLEGDSYDEITSGLTAGQEVVLTQTATTTSSTGTNGFPGGGGNFPGGGAGNFPGGGAGGGR